MHSKVNFTTPRLYKDTSNIWSHLSCSVDKTKIYLYHADGNIVDFVLCMYTCISRREWGISLVLKKNVIMQWDLPDHYKLHPTRPLSFVPLLTISIFSDNEDRTPRDFSFQEVHSQHPGLLHRTRTWSESTDNELLPIFGSEGIGRRCSWQARCRRQPERGRSKGCYPCGAARGLKWTVKSRDKPPELRKNILHTA